jgi:hypothetical protein
LQNNWNEFPVPFIVWIAPYDATNITAHYYPQYNPHIKDSELFGDENRKYLTAQVAIQNQGCAAINFSITNVKKKSLVGIYLLNTIQCEELNTSTIC